MGAFDDEGAGDWVQVADGPAPVALVIDDATVDADEDPEFDPW